MPERRRKLSLQCLGGLTSPNNSARIAEVEGVEKMQRLYQVKLGSKSGLFSSKASAHAVALGSDLVRVCIQMHLQETAAIRDRESSWSGAAAV